MRTTLTIDDDVAIQLQRLQKRRGAASFKDLVNEALRCGLRDLSVPPKKRKRFRTEVHKAGPPLLPDFDNVAEVLAIIEGEAYK